MIRISVNNSNNNHALINNNYVKTPRPCFDLQNSNGCVKNVFKIYRQFGHAPSEKYASPGLVAVSSALSHLPVERNKFTDTVICTVELPCV